jgi:inorganic triphosphatase YgiF
VADHLEVERKFEADASFTMPSLDGLPGVQAVLPPVVYQLAATYFDTADLALHRNKITLRHRTGGPDEGWHLKLPVSVDTRRELHEPLSPSVPPRLAAVVRDISAGQPLAPIAILCTERTVRRLTGPDGTTLGEVADDAVTARRLPADDPSAGLAWREIEVESADADVLAAAGRLLTEAGARPARSASKLGHLLDN